MNTYRTLTREARIVCVILAISILALLWAIQVDASLGDDYGALVLAGALATISALGAFIVTSELRDDNAKQLRARMSRLHTQQVNTLSEAIVKLETHNDNYARKFTALVIDNTKTNNDYKILKAWKQYGDKEVTRHLAHISHLNANYTALRVECDELAEALDELRYTVKAESERVADI